MGLGEMSQAHRLEMPRACASVEAIFEKLDAYCRVRDWAGFDPYDALNSALFARTPLVESRMARLALTQVLKRSPVNVRHVLGILPQRDPKGTALFLTSYVKRARLGDQAGRTAAELLADRLLTLRSPGTPYWCWGYSFPWQTRSLLVPRFAPNLVTTVFAANALLDAYQIGCSAECLTAGVSAGEYLAQELYWNDGTNAGFGYPRPDIRVPIYNANLLGAALLCRLARLTGEKKAVDVALSVARSATRGQTADGSWPYGGGARLDWIDNFHTGYNLCALQSICDDLATQEFQPVLLKGVQYYQHHFFTPDGAAKYFHNRTYPIDIHSVAQSLITLTLFRALGPQMSRLAESVLAWAMTHMWDDRGFFYYRVLRGVTIRTPYMRWSQAWMHLALSTLQSDAADIDGRGRDRELVGSGLS